MLDSFVRFINIIAASLLAGTSFGIWMGLNPKNYSAATYLEQQVNLVTSLNTLMVSMVVFATLITAASAFLHRSQRPAFVLLLLAAASFASCLVISRFGNLPIQQEMSTWTVDTLPGNWTALRDTWWSFHVYRTLAELVALVLVAWVSASRVDGSAR